LRFLGEQETDAAILSIIGYPAFSVTSPELVNTTLLTIQVTGSHGIPDPNC
jgi:hypothetical protein